jgi:uncharacterized membrane protein
MEVDDILSSKSLRRKCMADKQGAIGGVKMIIVGIVLQTLGPIVGVILGVLMTLSGSFGGMTIGRIVSIVGLVLFLVGLAKFKGGFDDEDGVKGSSNLFVAAILAVVGQVLGILPVVGGLIAGIVLIISYVFLIMGYSRLKNSTGYSQEGRDGANLLFIGAIILVVAVVINLIPLLGQVVYAIVSLVSLILFLMGWSKIKKGLEAA